MDTASTVNSADNLEEEATRESVQVCREYVGKVANLLILFSYADPVVKSQLCSVPLLFRLFQLMNDLELEILVKVLKAIRQLSMEPTMLDQLQRASSISTLVPFLSRTSGPYVNEIHNQVYQERVVVVCCLLLLLIALVCWLSTVRPGSRLPLQPLQSEPDQTRACCGCRSGSLSAPLCRKELAPQTICSPDIM